MSEKPNYKKMKTSELLDVYPSLGDDNYEPCMAEIEKRYPFDVMFDRWDDSQEFKRTVLIRLRDIDKVLKSEDRILKRLDNLTLAILKLSKKK